MASYALVSALNRGLFANGKFKMSATKSPVLDFAECSGQGENGADASEDESSKNEGFGDNPKIIFDTIAVQFFIEVFLRQFISHLIVPLSFCLLSNLEAQGLTLKKWFFVLHSYFFPMCIYLMILSYFLSSSDDQSVLSGALWIPLIYFIQHRLTIALKYASLSETEYERFMTIQDGELALKYQYQLQLLGGWLHCDRAVVEFELRAAAARIGAKIKQVEIVISSPTKSKSALSQLRNWNALMHRSDVINTKQKIAKELKQQPDGSYTVTAYDFCLAVIQKKLDNDFRGIAGITILLSAILNLLIPFITLAANENATSESHTVWFYVFLVTSSALNIFFGLLVYCLLFVAIFDVSRQLALVRSLHSMIRLTDLRQETTINFLPSARTCTSNVAASATNKAMAAIFKKKDDAETVSALEIEFADKSEKPQDGKTFREVYESDSDDEDVEEARPKKGGRKSPTPAAPVVATTPVVAAAKGGKVHENYLVMKEDGGRKNLSKRTAGRRKSSFLQMINNKLHLPLQDPPIVHTQYLRSSIIGEKFVADQDDAVLPRISFDYPENVLGWTYARLIMQNFGERFRFRIDIYVGGVLVLLMALMAIALALVITAKNKAAAFRSNFFLQSLLAVTMALIFLLIITYEAARINEELEMHSRTMSSHAMRIRTKMLQQYQQNNEERLERLSRVAEFIDASMDVLDVNTTLKPFKIFGFQASTALTISIATTGLSFYFVILNLYSTSDSQVTGAFSSIR